MHRASSFSRFDHAGVRARNNETYMPYVLSSPARRAAMAGEPSPCLQVQVALPSGQGTCLEVPACSTVQDLLASSQRRLNAGFLQLVTSQGQPLCDPDLLCAPSVCGMEILFAQLSGRSTLRRQELHLLSGAVGATQSLHGVILDVGVIARKFKLDSNMSNTFAAVLQDGSVVTWGDAAWGEDSSAVQGQLRQVLQIQATQGASSDPPPPRGGPGPFLTRKGAKFRGSTLLGE